MQKPQLQAEGIKRQTYLMYLHFDVRIVQCDHERRMHKNHLLFGISDYKIGSCETFNPLPFQREHLK